MQTKVSAKGLVVIPEALRTKLGIQAGDALEATIEGGRLVLAPRKRRRYRARIIKDPVTGFPTLDLGPNAPTLTSEMVKEMLAEFP